jgi:hypothetical protein
LWWLDGAVTRARTIALVVMAAAVLVISLASDLATWRIVVAVVVAGLLLRIGYAMISGLAQPVPEPPEPGTLRKVRLTYRCSICGTEVKMTSAAAEDPEPPRHCLEDMELVAPIME